MTPTHIHIYYVHLVAKIILSTHTHISHIPIYTYSLSLYFNILIHAGNSIIHLTHNLLHTFIFINRHTYISAAHTHKILKQSYYLAYLKLHGCNSLIRKGETAHDPREQILNFRE
jgi:hypothetical protein